MAIDDETLDRVRVALEQAERIDPARVHVTAENDHVVLRGAVATPEEASVAAMIAEQDVASVRNELRVDEGLREGSGHVEEPTDPAVEALREEETWEPPEQPSFAPTRAEERGAMAHETREAPPAPEGEDPDPDEAEPSAGDLSSAELREAARPRDRDRDEG